MKEPLFPEHAVPGIKDLMDHYSISIDDVSSRCAMDPDLVGDALSVFAFNACPLFLVATARTALHDALASRGWNGDVAKLWGEHDIRNLFSADVRIPGLA